MRRVVGLVSLLAGALAIASIMLLTEVITEPVRDTTWLFQVAYYIWLPASTMVKCNMAMNRRWPWLNIVALVGWLVMIVASYTSPDRGGEYSIDTITLVLAYVWLISWPVVDLMDFAVTVEETADSDD